MAAAAWRTWIMNEHPPTAVPSRFRGILGNRHRPMNVVFVLDEYVDA
jgi:hypothetical protein